MSSQNGDRHSEEVSPEQLTAYALGQLAGREMAEAKSAVSQGSELERDVREVRAVAAALSAVRNAEPLPGPSPELRERLIQRLADNASHEPAAEMVSLPEQHRRSWKRTGVVCSIVGGLCCVLLAVLLLPGLQARREEARMMQSSNSLKRIDGRFGNVDSPMIVDQYGSTEESGQGRPGASLQGRPRTVEAEREAITLEIDTERLNAALNLQGSEAPASSPLSSIKSGGGKVVTNPANAGSADPTQAESSNRRNIAVTPAPLISNDEDNPSGLSVPSRPEGYGGYLAPLDYGQPSSGAYGGGYGASGYGGMPAGGYGGYPGGRGDGSYPGYDAYGGGYGGGGTQGQGYGRPAARASSSAGLSDGRSAYPGYPGEIREENRFVRPPVTESELQSGWPRADVADVELRSGWPRAKLRPRTLELGRGQAPGTEQYAPISENAFVSPLDQPLSTFSIDVDTASYANVRRFLTGGRLPPPDAVRIEELVNYFRYEYPQPKGDEPFSVNMEVAQCPWREGHLLLRVGLKGKDVHRAERPQSHLVFLLDVSGSMADENKLPLLKTAMQMLVGELGENDRVSIVTYASNAGLRLPPTRGHEQDKIRGVIDSLSAGGSTHGSAGIQLAYEQAAAYFARGGANRVILCTDGDLNVGITDDDALVKLIKEKAAGGTFLTVLGFGEGNLKDAKMERLADNGNGVYAYIDSVREARKVLVEQLTGSTITIAKDVKIQIEFNPQEIAGYRLIGYENRVLAAEDFADDKKDAGEIGAGHTVTALYELAPVGAAADGAKPRADAVPLRYQESGVRNQESESVDASSTTHHSPLTHHRLTDAAKSGELLTLKLRYKEPDGSESKLLEHPLKDRGGSFNAASRDMQFAASVAGFGMILRGSEHRGGASLAAIAEIAAGSLGDDPGGYRAEFLDLVRRAQALGAR